MKHPFLIGAILGLPIAIMFILIGARDEATANQTEARFLAIEARLQALEGGAQ